MAVTYLRKVQINELAQVIEIIEEAKQVLKGRGVDLWQDGYPDENILRSDIERGIAYFLIKDAKIVGVAALEDQGEASYEHIEDGQWSKQSQAHYAIIHRVAIAQGHQGEGLSSIFIQHLLTVSASLSIHDIRIDTHFDNLAMQHVIEKNGFNHCGTIRDDQGRPLVAYQRFI
ncbi:GNAT family N-acetyltransferase [Bombilactobacillus bombi]|uniref:GNAT family N-acetyltransferase n=1 Tax=Bombilactobacillus bombi TaxID=1303590 RepID=UPI0015E5AEEE|nr:GNAT family N-acetyltransferase [Bombilactobacillus bombi]MBA1392624.1 GNAT family N-acetyltransferase [Lactobacillus sp. XV13L]MBA1433973.1 GNAT family N-acetyltransferase [Bombilactobacillus bombi]